MDWKILAVIIVAAAIILSGLFAKPGIDIFKGIKESLGNIISTFSPPQQNITGVSLNALLSAEKGEIRFGNLIDSIALEFVQTEFFVGTEKIVLNASANMKIEKFDGKLDYNFSGQASLDGKAETIFVSEIGIFPHEGKTVSVRGDIKTDSIKIYNTTLQKLSLNSSGILSSNEKFTAKIENEILELSDYKGDMEISGPLTKLKGFANKITIYGKNKISIE